MNREDVPRVCKFKPNMLTTFMFTMLEIIGPFSVGMPIMVLLMDDGDRYTPVEMLSMFPACLLILVLTVVFCCALNLVTYPFTKRAVYLDDDSVMLDKKRVMYTDVTEIVLDSGMIQRVGPSEPCCLDLYQCGNLILSIDHPSLLMMLLVLRRCKHARFQYQRTKKVFLIWGITLLICIGLGLFDRLGS